MDGAVRLFGIFVGARMIDGILVINLDPPYAGFSSKYSRCIRHCTVDELCVFLNDLGHLAPGQSWPPREYILRLPGSFSKDALAKFGLIDRAALRVVPSHAKAS